MRFGLVLIIHLLAIIGFAQTALYQLPKVNIHDLRQTHCPIDSSADAQIIYDYGKTRFIKVDGALIFQFEKTIRIQIFNADGLEHANLSIQYYDEDNDNRERLDYFKATSYTLDGNEIVEHSVRRNALIDEQINKYWSRMKYAFPNVQPGSIIEYSYIISSPFLAHIRDWEFQTNIPILKSKFSISVCPYVSYIMLKRGFLEYDKERKYTESFGGTIAGSPARSTVYEWEMYDVPAFKNEKYITTREDYIMSIRFQLEKIYGFNGGQRSYSSTWQELINQLLRESQAFGGYIKENNQHVSDLMLTMDLTEKSEMEKIRTITKYVKENFTTNGYGGKYTSQRKKDVIKTKNGSIPEINLLLLSMLRNEGIEAYPFLISTRSHGKPELNYPMLSSFNYVAVIVKLDGGGLIIDGTDPLLPFGMLPYECINEYGLEVRKIKRKEDALFYPINSIMPDKENTKILMQYNPDSNIISVQISKRLSGYSARNARSIVIEYGKEALVEKICPVSVIPEDIKVSNLENIEKNLGISYRYKIPVTIAGDKMILEPFHINSYKEPFLTKEERKYPVDFGYETDEKYIFTFQIPDGYEIDYIPENYSQSLLDNRLIHNIKSVQEANILQILSEVKQLKPRFEPEEYSDLKLFYDMIVDHHNQKIILKKSK